MELSLRSENETQASQKVYLANQIEASARSSAALIPHILKLFPSLDSVVDVGCGIGEWLNQFSLHGVSKLLGIDIESPGSHFLAIAEEQFLQKDLSMPFSCPERFDLAISLEVAERIAPEYSHHFLNNLIQLSDVIIFSAAIPNQNSVSYGNEQWPSYWHAMFKSHGYDCVDILRSVLWYDERIEWCYRQNILIFVKNTRVDLLTHLEACKRTQQKLLLDMVHPHCFSGNQMPMKSSLYTENVDSSDELFALRRRLAAIEKSIGWRVILKSQRMVSRFPRLKRMALSVAKYSWRFLSMKRRSMASSI